MSTASSAFRPSHVVGLMPSPSSMYYQTYGLSSEDQKPNERHFQRRSTLTRMRHHSSFDGARGTLEDSLDAQAYPADFQRRDMAQHKDAVPRSTSLPKAPISSHLSHGNLYYGQQSLSARDYSYEHVSGAHNYCNPANDSQTCVNGDGYNFSSQALGGGSSADYESLRHEWQSTVAKLNATMNSIKSFWSPELKKERIMRKEESAKLLMLQDQLKMAIMNSQKQSAMIEQLQAELRFQCDGGRVVAPFMDGSIPAEEVQNLRHERDMYRHDYLLSVDSMKQLEYQLEGQRQTLINKEQSIKRLLEALHAKATNSTSVDDRLGLEMANGRIEELEAACGQYEAECAELKAIISQQSGQHGAYGEAAQVIQRLEGEIESYEQLLNRRDQSGECDSEINRLKLMNERVQLESSQKSLEIQALQTRLSTVEESAGDFKKHLELIKESNSNKEQQLTLLQADIDALRAKLEAKNETIDQKAQQMNDLQAERNRLVSEVNLLNEQVKLGDVGLATCEKKIELLEETIREKECEKELLRQRLHSSSAVMQQKELQEEIERLNNECEAWRRRCTEEQELRGSERKSVYELHEKELSELRLAITSLQKEITDRQVYIESQNERIGDLDRQNSNVLAENEELKKVASSHGAEMMRKEISRLNDELLESRSEIDRLLKIVRSMEQQETNDDWNRKKKTTSLLEAAEIEAAGPECQAILMQRDRRIEELEEALKESVSITAEREIAVAQQKQLSQQLEQRCVSLQMQLKSIEEQVEQNDSTVGQLKQEREEKERIIQSLQMEHKRHLEDAMKLKEEALLAAISEKDAHLALLENSQSGRSAEDIETLQRQKEKLLKRLKEVNAQRMGIFKDNVAGENLCQLIRDFKVSSVDQDDDGEENVHEEGDIYFLSLIFTFAHPHELYSSLIRTDSKVLIEMGVSWVFHYVESDQAARNEQPELTKVESMINALGAEYAGPFTLDAETFYPSTQTSNKFLQVTSLQICIIITTSLDVMEKPVQVFYSSEYPATTFATTGDLMNSSHVTGDLAFFQMIRKLQGAYVTKPMSKVECRGKKYHLNDFCIRFCTASIGGHIKGVLIEVEYVPSMVPSMCSELLRQFCTSFLEKTIASPPAYIAGMKTNQTYAPIDTMNQYNVFFQRFRKTDSSARFSQSDQ